MNMSDSQRINGWVVALRALHAQPLWLWPFGWGPETFRSVYRLYRTQQDVALLGAQRVADHTHNLFLELPITIGLVGTLAVGYLSWDLWEHVDLEARAAMIGLFVVSMVEPVFFAPAAMLFFLLGANYWPVRQSAKHIIWPRVGATILALAAAWIWVDDRSNPRRSLALHPRESEANQMAAAESLQQGQIDLAALYAQRAAMVDPQFKELVAQTRQLEAFAKARRAR